MSKIEDLLKSPIYAMSLGSKELFHSNFWWFLIENDHSFAKAFFYDIYCNEINHCERESRNRDLVIVMNNGSNYVIENKIKSIPNIDQLKKYEDKTSIFLKGVLTGIKETLNIGNTENWMFLSYKDISKSIRYLTLQSKEEIIIENKSLINEYCDVVDLLSDVILERLDETEKYLNYSDRGLSKIRFDDVYKKFKSEDFLSAFLRQNSNDLRELKIDGIKFLTYTYYANKNAGIDIRYKIEDQFVIGVQIQGNQFRIVAERSNANQCKEVFEEFLKYGWFDPEFDYKNHRLIMGRPTTMTPREGNKFNKYETSRYSFVYQFFNLNKETSKYENLFILVLNYLRIAKDIIIKNNLIIDNK